MKRSSLLLAALALPLAAFAADTTVTKVDGDGVTITTDSGIGKVAIGDKVLEGQSIDCGSSSSAEIKLPNGGTLTLAPGTRILFRAIQNGTDLKNYSYEIVLLRGSISGNAGNSSASSSFNIVTTSGVADVSKSGGFTVNFTPTTTTTGGGSISSSNGVIGFTPTGSTGTTQINKNEKLAVGSGATGSPVSFTSVASTGGSTTGGTTGGTTTGTNTPASDNIEKKTWVPLPDFSLLVISPNGN